MHTVKMKGKTTEEAIEGALQVLKIPRDRADIRIISEGEPGVLGVFGGKDAEVEVKAKLETADQAKVLLQEMLDRMGFLEQVYVVDDTQETVFLEIKGDDISRIIGKDGNTLNSIQYLINVMSNKGKEIRKRIDIDAGGYKKKQEKRIEGIARETIDEVLISGKEIELPPMNPRERRIVHIAVKENPKVESYSRGEKDGRRVVIAPAK